MWINISKCGYALENVDTMSKKWIESY